MNRAFLSGLIGGLSDEIAAQRAETRKREDAELERRAATLDFLREGVANGTVLPEHYAQILKDQLAVGEALAGPRKRKGGARGFVTGESDLSVPLGGILDDILSGRVGGREADEAPAPQAPPALPLPPPPPQASAETRVAASVGPATLPTPFNPPRFVGALSSPGAQAIAAAPRPLFTNPARRAAEQARAAATTRRGIEAEDREALLARAEADTSLTPEQRQQIRLQAQYGLPTPPPRPLEKGNIIHDPESPTGAVQTLFDSLTGEERARILAELPPDKFAEGDRIPEKERAAMRGALRRDPPRLYSELTDADARAIDAYEKSQRGTPPAPGLSAASTAANLQQLFRQTRTSPVAKDFKEMGRYVSNIDEALREAQTTKNFVAIDQTLINAFNKLNDPTSVVRESEYKRTAEDISLINRLRGKVGPDGKLAVGGAGLTPSDREALGRMAKRFYAAAEREYTALVDDLRLEASALGLADQFNEVYPDLTAELANAETQLANDPPGTELTLNGRKYVKLTNGFVVPRKK